MEEEDNKSTQVNKVKLNKKGWPKHKSKCTKKIIQNLSRRKMKALTNNKNKKKTMRLSLYTYPTSYVQN